MVVRNSPIERNLTRVERGRTTLVWRSIAILALFAGLCGDLVAIYFGDDDFINLYRYVDQGWSVAKGLIFFWSSNYYRPLGGVAYLSLYDVFGLVPLPFRVTVLVILTGNLLLAGYVAYLLLASKRLALLVMLMVCYHAAAYELYYNFGTIYDLLCFSFLYGGMAVYLHQRVRNRPITWGWLALLVLLQIGALDSKEMGVALPAILLLYEIVIGQSLTRGRRQWRAFIPGAVLSGIVLIFLAGKSVGPQSLSQHPLYRPHLSMGQYAETMSRYLDLLFYAIGFFTHARTIAFLAGGVLIAVLVRSRLMLFGWLWFLVAMLPLAFIPARAGFVLYIPEIGLAVAGVAFWQKVYQFYLARISSRWSSIFDPEGTVAFLLVLISASWVHYQQKIRFAPIMKVPLAAYQHFAEEFSALRVHPKPGARILIMNDPFPERSWDSILLPGLLRRDLKLRSARGRFNFLALSPALQPLYDEIYDYREDHVIPIPKALLPSYIKIKQAQIGYLEAVSGVYAAVDESLWTKQEFQLRAGCPAAVRTCVVAIWVSLPVGAYAPNEPRRITIRDDGKLLADVPVTSAIDWNELKAPIDSQPGGHTLTYQLDKASAPSSHPWDRRELGVVLRHAVIIPQ